MASADRLSQTLKQRIGGGGATIEDAYNLLVGILNGDEPAILSGGSSLNRFAAPIRLTTFDGVTNAGATLTDSLTGRDAPSLLVRGQHGVHQEIEKSGGGKVFGAYDSGIELGDTLVDGTFDVTGVSTFEDDVFVQNGAGTVLAHFDVTAGAQKVVLGEQSATPGLLVDVANGRTQIGAVTLPTGLAGDKFDVIGGRTYLVANNEDISLGLRYGSGAVGSYFLGASNAAAPDLVWRNNAGTQRMRLLDGGNLIVGGATAPFGTESLRVAGGARIEGALTVTSGGATIAGGVTVSSTGVDVTGNSTFHNALDVTGALTVGGNSHLSGTLQVDSTAAFNGATAVDAAASFTASGNASLAGAAKSLGFYGSSGVTIQTLTGNTSGSLAQLQAAFRNLVAILSNGSLNLLIDSTT